MDKLKQAFKNIKEDMDFFKTEIDSLKSSLSETRQKMIEICELMTSFNKKIKELSEKQDFLKKNQIKTLRHINPTTSTHSSTHKHSFEPLKDQNLSISTGNRGVPTDRQTDTSTDRQTQKIHEITQNTLKINTNSLQKKNINSIDNVIEVLNSLDNLKKEIRLKFKRLTEQEILVFSTIYQLNEDFGHTDYKVLSERLNLTESSIRDYVGRLIKKGIPVDKKKINNKTIHLTISDNLKKIATLSTILKLREI